MMMADSISALVAAELGEAVDPQVSEMAAAIAAQYPDAARAVLFYGSCLRQQQLDGLMLDFYLIVSSYAAAYGRRWLAAANRLVPPNVFPFAHGGLTAKYAVLSEEDFRRECSAGALTPSVWARFAQPSRLAWAADDEAAAGVVHSVAQAAPTLHFFAAPMVEDAAKSDPLEIWRRGFSLTYGCELRAERQDRSSAVVASDPERYLRFADALLGTGNAQSRNETERVWRRFRRRGKRATVLRLLKASFTFAGGIDYLAWKINRHAGTRIVVAPWQRRWPLLAAVILLPRLLARGAVR
jgi:hypothetical protein